MPRRIIADEDIDKSQIKGQGEYLVPKAQGDSPMPEMIEPHWLEIRENGAKASAEMALIVGIRLAPVQGAASETARPLVSPEDMRSR
jgi:hypothetical protein